MNPNPRLSPPIRQDRFFLEVLRVWARSRGTARGRMSLLLVAAGIGTISQGWVKPVVSAAWEAAFGKPVHFPDVSPLWGVLLIVLGLDSSYGRHPPRRGPRAGPGAPSSPSTINQWRRSRGHCCPLRCR